MALKAFVDSGHPPTAVLTLPMQRAGRHSDFHDLRPVSAAAGAVLIEAANVNSAEALRALREVDPDFVFVIGWSQLLGAELLRAGRAAPIGYHPAALPLNRGRAAIPWTILQRATETGSTFFWIDEGTDSGDILSQELFPVASDETARSLYDKHLASISRQLRSLLPRLAQGECPRTPQDHRRATYCARRTPDDGLIDWQASADDVWTLIRATGRPYPGAFTFWREQPLRVWEAAYVGSAPYSGVPGQVQRIDQEGALVRCGDGRHVLLQSVECEAGEAVAPATIMKNHEKLGLDLLALRRALYRETAS